MEATEAPGPFAQRQILVHDEKVAARRILRPKRGLNLTRNLLNQRAEGSFTTVMQDVRRMKRKLQETEEKGPDTKRPRRKEDRMLLAGNPPHYTPMLARNRFPQPESMDVGEVPMDVKEELAPVRALETTAAPPKQKRYLRKRAVDRFPQVLRNAKGTNRKMENAEESSPSNKRYRTDQDQAATSTTRRPPLKATRGGIKAAALRKRFTDNSQREPQDCQGRKRKLEKDEVMIASVEQVKLEAAGKTEPLSKRRKADQGALRHNPPKARKRLPRQAKNNAVNRIHEIFGVPAERIELGQNAAAEEADTKGMANEKIKKRGAKKEAEEAELKRVDISPDDPQQKQLGKRKAKAEPPQRQKQAAKKKEKKKKKKEEEKLTQKSEAVTISEAEVQKLLKTGKELGAGAYGTAYKVVHKGEVAVLKVANSRLWSVKAVFKKEAKVLQALNGAGGAPLLLGTCSKPTAILMEYCPGEEFLSIIYDTKNFPSLALEILSDIARKLHQIHLAGYVHVDLKPDNVMVHVQEDKGNKQVKPRIIDFGLAVEKGTKIQLYPNMSYSIYPPEYSEGAPARPWGDVYSMGCLIEDTVYAFYDDIPEHYEEIISMAKNENPKLRPTLPKLVKQLEAALKRSEFKERPQG
ncbi:trichohyalin-like [Macrobrachium nipponense]|uniref:trichohyalin-like n=1 Tax=Macrobrachium nipponense TaxID=159736 RepID=UPI0030C7A9DF